MITRRQILSATIALAVAVPLPAQEITVRRLRLTWSGGARTQIDYQNVPAYPAPELGCVDFGGGVVCVVEEA